MRGSTRSTKHPIKRKVLVKKIKKKTPKGTSRNEHHLGVEKKKSTKIRRQNEGHLTVCQINNHPKCVLRKLIPRNTSNNPTILVGKTNSTSNNHLTIEYQIGEDKSQVKNI
jgi:hypothetical protein